MFAIKGVDCTENWYVCLHFCVKVSATFSNFCEIFCSTWFQQQQEFTNEIENMEVDELNKCLAKVSFP